MVLNYSTSSTYEKRKRVHSFYSWLCQVLFPKLKSLKRFRKILSHEKTMTRNHKNEEKKFLFSWQTFTYGWGENIKRTIRENWCLNFVRSTFHMDGVCVSFSNGRLRHAHSTHASFLLVCTLCLKFSYYIFISLSLEYWKMCSHACACLFM